MRRQKTRSKTNLLLLLVVAIACIQGHDTAFSIISGDAVTQQEQEDKGLVMVGGVCSGVLLANDWVLTAGHCIANDRVPTSVAVVANWGTEGNRNRTSDTIYRFASFNQERGPDVALAHLSVPFAIHGSTTGYTNNLYNVPNLSLLNAAIISYGVGGSVYASASQHTTISGFGTWRRANLTIKSVSDETFILLPNSSGQINAPGDSGGPDFTVQNNTNFITGIHSGCDWDSYDATRDKLTITNIKSCSSTSVPVVHDRLLDVLKSQSITPWNPLITTQTVQAFQGEIDGTRWGFRDVNLVNWTQAARSADAMCYNRGFLSGHFNGNQRLDLNGYGVQCVNNGAVWLNATTGDIASTEWGFIDANTVPWAQANRAAYDLCLRRGFVGGHFNGNQLLGIGAYGLICYKDGAQLLDATSNDLIATGWPVGDLNTTAWAQAARAATGFCISKGFSGGFMNGHQILASGDYGVICQRNSASSILTPALSINYTSGQSGSYFTLDGINFPANIKEVISVNGRVAGSAQTDSFGNFSIVLSTKFANDGEYTISTTVTPSMRINLILNSGAPFYQKEGNGPEINLVNEEIYLPVVSR